jgi:hypothetical protein
MSKALGSNVTNRCVESLMTGDEVPLHRAQEAIERYVLTHKKRGPAARELEHDRLRETDPLQKLVRNTYRSIGGR